MTPKSSERARDGTVRLSRRQALRLLGAGALTVGGGAILQACTPAPSTGTTTGSVPTASAALSTRQLRIAIPGSPPSLDFQVQTARAALLVGSHIWEPLFAYNSKYEPTPMLLESSELDSSRTTYTWRLRRGIKFHNGKEMTSEDVEASILRWKTTSPSGSALAALDTIDRPDAYTVRVKLKSPRGALLNDLAQFTSQLVAMPKELTSAKANEIKEYVGTGPFKFKEWQSDQYVLLERFDDYKPRTDAASGWAGAKQALVKELRFQNVSEAGVRASGLEAGDFEFADSLALDDYARLSRNTNLNMQVVKPGSWPMAAINHAKPPFDNLKARQALQAAMDSDQIMQGAAGNPTFYGIDPSICYKETIYASTVGKDLYNQKNISKAKALLAESGYNKQPVVILASKTFPFHYNGAVVMKAQMEQAGFVVDLQSPDFTTIVQRRTNQDAWNILLTHWGGAVDPSVFTANWHSASKSWGWFVNADMDRAIDAAAAASTFDQRKKAVDDMQRIYYEQVVAIKWGDLYDLSGLRATVEGYPNFKFPTFWNVSLK